MSPDDDDWWPKVDRSDRSCVWPNDSPPQRVIFYFDKPEWWRAVWNGGREYLWWYTRQSSFMDTMNEWMGRRGNCLGAWYFNEATCLRLLSANSSCPVDGHSGSRRLLRSLCKSIDDFSSAVRRLWRNDWSAGRTALSLSFHGPFAETRGIHSSTV